MLVCDVEETAPHQEGARNPGCAAVYRIVWKPQVSIGF